MTEGRRRDVSCCHQQGKRDRGMLSAGSAPRIAKDCMLTFLVPSQQATIQHHCRCQPSTDMAMREVDRVPYPCTPRTDLCTRAFPTCCYTTQNCLEPPETTAVTPHALTASEENNCHNHLSKMNRAAAAAHRSFEIHTGNNPSARPQPYVWQQLQNYKHRTCK